MSSLQSFQKLGVCIIVASVFALIYWNFTIQKQSSTNRETYTSELHSCILELTDAWHLHDPAMALVKITSARKCIQLLSKLAGGDHILSQITGKDVANILNVSVYQEQQTRKYLKTTNPHPLDSELQS